ncbi:hypothetical protein GCM10023231_09700 [Olivibacter ginsenosidimutans]|uniref:Beta-lactamase-related domain-containing protein n=1 Tax=Olivibacter ginsenosidimutans TaxID=1176537 RepID=A0ABP9APM9_9SPHI
MIINRATMHIFKHLYLLSLTCLVTCTACAQNAQQNDIKEELAHQKRALATTLVLNNEQGIIPLQKLQQLKIASINIGFKHAKAFNEMLAHYAPVDTFETDTAIRDLKILSEQLKFHNLLIIQVANQVLAHQSVLDFINHESANKHVILCGFGTLNQLALVDKVHIPIVWSPDTSEVAANGSASGIFGGIAFSGRLTENVSPHYPSGSGFTTIKTRLGYCFPEAVGIKSANLIEPIGQIVREAIAAKATPGAVVMVVKNGEIIFEQGYGFHTYTNDVPTRTADIFDMASVSKITATTLAVMRLEEQKKIDLNETIGHYLLQARHTNKEHIKLRDVMLHQAGFIPYIPFYRHLNPDDLSRDSSAAYNVKLADGRYLRSNYYQDVMWPEMLQSKLQSPGKYVYSDISMYVMKEVVEQQSSEPIQHYVQEQFYQPLGMYHTGYNPRLRFLKDQIVPTENDTSFRDTLLQGYVHDQGAAMANGVAGHAGIFSTANDLAIYAQMLLNKGTYGGEIYFSQATVDEYTSKQSTVSRRGFGFDRKDPDPKKEYPSKLASPATFGHTGYTGTCIWIDPEHQLTYIFLSNRVHPFVTDKLSDMNIRSRIQDAIYKAIAEGME